MTPLQECFQFTFTSEIKHQTRGLWNSWQYITLVNSISLKHINY